MKEQLQKYLQCRLDQCVLNDRDVVCPKIERKKELASKRNAEIVKVIGKGWIKKTVEHGDHTEVLYQTQLTYLVKQLDLFYIEEEIESRIATFAEKKLVDDREVDVVYEENHDAIDVFSDERVSYPYTYDRQKAVQYAERWWNSYNPAYKQFEVDCTNYISQCLHAGGAPMRGYPNRGRGWWMMHNNWSYSWSVANSLRLYLTHSTVGLKAKEVYSPDELLLGDVICYDFQGDGRYDHNTIVTGKDAYGMPLVNAHTTNSRLRYWSYEDSSAYTPNIQYKFFSIVDHP
ncbi:amidase domain-containing protein [Aeribacillus pallidus]|jgi:hypothetical protein|uniref:amidase domain-containing protein n=1 Tax=Aeribacillus pallidus TaxID=33936 RepID=UPI003D201E5F